MTGHRCDVAILGGGAAGLTLALQLHRMRPATSIVVLERQDHPVPEAAHKVGESTVEIAGHYLRSVLGLEAHLTEQQLQKFGLRMFFSEDGNQDITRRVELGHAVRPPHGVGTYQVDRGRLENALGLELAARGIPFRPGHRVQEVQLRPERDYHVLRVASETGQHELEARWVVDATGRSSLLKRQLGLSKKVEHRANAVWFRLGHRIDIDQWSTDPQWRGRIRDGRRELSTNHLLGTGYWVWLIPLASESISIGIVTDADLHNFQELNRFERAMAWLHQHEPQCAQAIEAHRDKLQDFRVMKNYAYSCEQVYSAQRWCLTGESGVFLDPLYSPGLDLIAISNGLVADLIGHALDGADIEERAAIHNQIYLIITEGWLRIYDQQYPLMGNARVMLAKVVWDTAVYWAVPGLLYFHDQLRQLAEHPAIVANLARLSVVSEHIQRFFREWARIDESKDAGVFVSFYDFDFMARLHIGMTAGLADAELESQLDANLTFIEQLSGQLVSTVMAECAANRDGPVVQEQLERWRRDEALLRLVDSYRQRDQDHPISDGWITINGARPARQEVAG